MGPIIINNFNNMLNQMVGEEGAKRVSKWIAISLAFLSLFLLVKIIGDLKRLPRAGSEVYPQSTIMATGQGEAYAIPDIGTFNFTVTEKGDTVKQAQEKLDQKINKALSAVRESGVEDKDIKTTNYSVSPNYEWQQAYCVQTVGAMCPPGKNVLKGYEVSQTVTVKVRKTENAADLVTKVGAINVSNISGLEFTVDDRDKYVAEAREEAINKAKENAKKLAKELGVSLGKMLYFNENGGYPYYGEAMGMGGGSDVRLSAAAPTFKAELPTGETKITSQVSITYEIR
jgi:uncharacterized protein YggE